MAERCEVAIVGLGAMGSAAAYQLAMRGRRVVGFDRFHPPHTLGSSHGYTRIIREAYPEGAGYVPLVQRAYELWADLEAASGRSLLTITGGLVIDSAGGAPSRTAIESASVGGIAIEELSAADVSERFPSFRLNDDQIAIYEPRAGVLSIEDCITAHLDGAATAGADLRFDTVVEGWTAGEGGFELTSSAGTVSAERLVLSAGPWLPGLLGRPSTSLTVERQVQCWFEPVGDGPRPVSIWPAATSGAYTIPDLGRGVKVAAHHGGVATSPDEVDRVVSDADVEPLRPFIEQHLPGVSPTLRDASVCMYTNTPDEDFLIDVLPEDERIVVVSPCSGHGFKFSSAIGEAVAELVTTGAATQPLEAFRFDRAALAG
jgi:sarcosine oxidase